MRSLWKVISTVLLVFFLLACPSAQVHQDSTPAIVVTGASSGIGRATAEHLARNGYYIYAGARSQKDLEQLESIPNVTAIRLDVTSQTEIAAAVERVKQEGRPLKALINNAGIAVVGPLSELSDKDLERQFQVNVMGPFRMTNSFLPLLSQHRGRVLNISSLTGFVSGGFFAPYAMSKHALEAYSDGLAEELAGRGVKVVTVVPGGYSSSIFDDLLAQRPNPQSEYHEQMETFVDRVSRRPARPPSDLAPLIQRALEDQEPQRRLYLGLSVDWEGEMLVRAELRKLAQLNHGHPHSYTREQLISMLDEALETYPARAEADEP